MTDLTWQQKHAAMRSLLGQEPLDAHIDTSTMGIFCTCIGGEICGDGLLRSVCGRGKTAQEAVEDAWKQMTEIPSDHHVYVSRSNLQVRWNGFMWEQVKP